MRRRLVVALGVVGAIVLAGCGSDSSDEPSLDPVAVSQSSAPSTTPEPTHAAHAAAVPAKLSPLRKGERRATLQMAEDYTPSAPNGVGTDDYRCFVMDPGLDQDAWLTGTQVLPGNADVVHHVILFRATPDQIDEAEAIDARTEDPGWTCFGGSGLSGEFQNVDDANWLGAWAPGGGESLVRRGHGVDLPKGSRIIMQVHYNLLAGTEPDRSATLIRWRPKQGDVTPLHTMLMPAPVELPCRPGRGDGPLCDRDAALADAKERFGHEAGSTADLLHLLCGTQPTAGPTTDCVRYVQRPMTILGAAGHMHLLGTSLKIVAHPNSPERRTVLDLPVWDFDDQAARDVEPVHLDRGDQVQITCEHSQALRDRLPAFEGQQEKYVLWAEGTTDEMCLGMLQVAFDDE